MKEIEWRPIVGFSKYEINENGDLRKADTKEPVRKHIFCLKATAEVENDNGNWGTISVAKILRDTFGVDKTEEELLEDEDKEKLRNLKKEIAESMDKNITEMKRLQDIMDDYNLEPLIELFFEYTKPEEVSSRLGDIAIKLGELITRDELTEDGVSLIHLPDYQDVFFFLGMMKDKFDKMQICGLRNTRFDVVLEPHNADKALKRYKAKNIGREAQRKANGTAYLYR